MPKHENNPHKGFIYSVYNYEPVNVSHWIAPDALAKFGSNFSEVIDISQTPADDLKYYIENGNPVITYVTASFKPPIITTQEVPLNLHVVLLTGFNNKTDEYIVLDPYFGRMVIKKSQFENSYNYLKYAVVVK